ncbi:MAG: RNA polymerase sigma factor [Candidatus Tectimicrobiota bacterium]
MDTSDASLLTRMAQRDAQALELFYVQHARAVYSLVLFMLDDEGRAAELTQDIFLLVWRSAGAYQATGSARAWLLRLARNRAIDELRRERRRRQSEAAATPQPTQIATAIPDVAELAAQRAVHEVLHILPAEQSEALRLAFFQGFSHQEIATHLRTPLGTIKARIRRALLALRKHLQGDEPV